MENEKLMELPYGEKFKKCWIDYVQFMKDNNRDASIKAQNYTLSYFIKKNFNEDEAIESILSMKEIAIKYLIK